MFIHQNKMGKFQCTECLAEFASKFNMQRHMANKHNVEEEAESDEVNNSGSDSDSDSDSHSEIEEDKEYNHLGERVFNLLLSKSVVAVLPDGFAGSASELTREPLFSHFFENFIERVRAMRQEHDAFIDLEIIKSIKKAKEDFEEDDDCDSQEADHRAWENRKFKIKSVLREFCEKIQNKMKEQDLQMNSMPFS